MIDIIVLSREDIEKFKTDKKHIVISVRDPKANLANLPNLDSRMMTLYLQFPDFDKKMKGYQYNHLIFNKQDARY